MVASCTNTDLAKTNKLNATIYGVVKFLITFGEFHHFQMQIRIIPNSTDSILNITLSVKLRPDDKFNHRHKSLKVPNFKFHFDAWIMTVMH